ncbi:hypothetical protein J421_3031 [Gemmatirosa kalamazoonensis]|uniref:PEP motif anchor domain protein n=1 Tax=Gemmatirosa kalamazoonensis TaxID=861299 RepID=W0RM99_9BACT|nr:hypothetical protein [Gemmatirosa kalamazoonensis]AHG90568.1 hypothetical protein J421_3031 [Gemmatirosa kalamazoonensis]
MQTHLPTWLRRASLAAVYLGAATAAAQPPPGTPIGAFRGQRFVMRVSENPALDGIGQLFPIMGQRRNAAGRPAGPIVPFAVQSGFAELFDDVAQTVRSDDLWFYSNGNRPVGIPVAAPACPVLSCIWLVSDNNVASPGGNEAPETYVASFVFSASLPQGSVDATSQLSEAEYTFEEPPDVDTVVPEPAEPLLVGAGLLGITAGVRSKK